MNASDWNSSIGYLLIFLIFCVSVLCLCGIGFLIKNFLDNRRNERERGRYVIQYIPNFDSDRL